MSDDDRKNPFVHFPLILLAYGKDQRDKLNAMLAHANINAGANREKILGGQTGAMKEIRSLKIQDSAFAPHDWRHRAWALGKGIIYYALTNPVACVQVYEQAQQFIGRNPKGPFVRVASSLITDVYKGAFDWRDFTVLCGVYAVIGEKAYAIVRRNRVRAGALGYKSGSVLFDEDGNLTEDGMVVLNAREDGAVPLSLKQCRTSLDHLDAKKFLSRFQPKRCGRTVFYSRSLDYDAFSDLLFKSMAKKMTRKEAQHAAQQQFRERMDALLKRPSQTDGQTGAGQGPDDGRTVGRFNICPSNKCSPNSCPSNRETHIAPESPAHGGAGEAPSVTQPTITPAAEPEWNEEQRKREAEEFKRATMQAIDGGGE